MKLATIEPFVGTPEVDREREIVAEEILAQSDTVSPISDTNTEKDETMDSHGESVGAGLSRLTDFLKNQNAKKQTSSRASKQSIATHKYKNQTCFEEEFLAQGKNLKVAA